MITPLALIPTATLADDNWLTMAAIMVPGAVIVIACVLMENWRRSQQTRQREESRREIAAYVAEGSITPDDAVKILAAGTTIKDKLGARL